jgi:hypothetical protein
MIAGSGVAVTGTPAATAWPRLSSQFPGNRENNREFAKFPVISALSGVSSSSDFNRLQAILCCSRNREFFRLNREFLGENREFPYAEQYHGAASSCGMIEIAAGATQLAERILFRASPQGPAPPGPREAQVPTIGRFLFLSRAK